MDGTCDIPKCKQSDHYSYIGKDLCEKHWQQLCESYDKGPAVENKLLARINLRRNKDGVVVQIGEIYNEALQSQKGVD